MLLIIFGFSLLASAITANKLLLATFSPLFFTGLRMLAGGLILAGIYSGKNRFSYSVIKQDAGQLIIIALFTTFFQSLFKAYALKYLLSSKAALIGSLDPFVTALFAYYIFNERLSFRKFGGILLGVAGAIYLCTTTTPLEQTFTSLSIFSLPELSAFAAVIVGRWGWLQAQVLLKLNKYKPIELNSIMMIISGVFSLSCSLFVEDLSYLSRSTFSGTTGLLFLYTVIVGNVIAYSLYASFLKQHSASFVSLVGFSVPLFVSLYGWFLLSEPITTTLLVASCLIMAGVGLFYSEEL